MVGRLQRVCETLNLMLSVGKQKSKEWWGVGVILGRSRQGDAELEAIRKTVEMILSCNQKQEWC